MQGRALAMNERQGKGEGTPTRRELVDELIELLDVVPVGDGRFRGRRKRGGVGRVYGGQVVAQALAAASKTVNPDRPAHSLHAYFLRGGSEDYEIDYRVEADFDGGSISNRRVIAMQRGQVIFNLAASFHVEEPGHFHQPPMPEVPSPEELEDLRAFIARQPGPRLRKMPLFLLRPSPMEIRSIGIPPFFQQEPVEAHLEVWFRAVASVDQPQWMQRALVAYASDFALITTAMRPHGNFDVQAASLDHSLWFHQDLRADDWLLYAIESPWAGGGRGLGLGRIFDRAGRLVASVAQEGMMRDPAMRKPR